MARKLQGAARTQKVRALALDAMQTAPSRTTSNLVPSFTRRMYRQLSIMRNTRNAKTRASAAVRAAVLAGQLTSIAKGIELEARETRAIARRAARLLEVYP